MRLGSCEIWTLNVRNADTEHYLSGVSEPVVEKLSHLSVCMLRMQRMAAHCHLTSQHG